jgi:hypothetical protein
MNRALTTLGGRLWRDDCGALLAVEWVVVATILVLGIIPGLVAVQSGTISELTEWANAVLALDQSYSFAGHELTCDQDNGRWDHDRTVDGMRRSDNFLGVRPQGSDTKAGWDDGRGQTGARGTPLAWKAGSAAIDKCDRLQTRSAATPACTAENGPCTND